MKPVKPKRFYMTQWAHDDPRCVARMETMMAGFGRDPSEVRIIGEDEIERVVAEVVREMGASSPREMGPVMKQCMARFAGRLVDGKKVSDAVRRRLEKTG